MIYQGCCIARRGRLGRGGVGWTGESLMCRGERVGWAGKKWDEQEDGQGRERQWVLGEAGS